MQEQGKVYSEAVATKGHGLGESHLYIFGSLLDYLASVPDAMDPIKTALRLYETWSLRVRAEHVKMCRVVKLYKEGNRKLIRVLGNGAEAQELRRLILPLLEGLEEWSFVQGRPPPGHMERLLSQWALEIVS